MLLSYYILIGVLVSTSLAFKIEKPSERVTKVYPKCSGQKQSPIDVKHGASLYDRRLQEIHITRDVLNKRINESDNAETWTITNDCKGVSLAPVSVKYSFVQMPENVTFNLLQWHFHWHGSEHQLNGRYYPAEIHMVHQSASNSSQLAVIGLLLETVDLDNENMEPLVKKLVNVADCNASIIVSDLELGSILPLRIDKFYRYSGSLTTPGCDEVVEWYIVESPNIVVSDMQLLKFQGLKDMNGNRILTNARALQDLNGRTVRRNFDHFLEMIRRGN